LSILQNCHELVQSPHRYARDWKARTGGKVLGYLCSNLPEELLCAAGVLPVRLLGSNEVDDLTGNYIFQAGFCNFSRDCFAQALRGRYDYLDGVVIAQCCPHTREVFINWQELHPEKYFYQLESPMYLQNPHAQKYLESEIGDLKKSLEVWTGQAITFSALDKAISECNRNRSLMMQVFDFLKEDKPRISEAEAAEIALAGFLTDKVEHNRLLEGALAEISARPAGNLARPRLMLLGSVNTDIAMINFIDSLGGKVVIDDYCTGNRYYQQEVVPGENRIAALAARLIEKPPCPLKDIPERKRVTHILNLVDSFRVQGIIYTIQRQCDAHGLDYPALASALKQKGVPLLKLEMDSTLPVGQFRTRIEAFLEMIEGV
jgi:benzoyl-CoA reductase subunit C